MIFRLFSHGLLALGCLMSSISSAEQLRWISYDGEALAHNKATLSKQHPALSALLKKADAALDAPIDPVTNKTLLPASGDRHDYFSFGPYWWPNPDTDNGLPYVKRDGQVNQDSRSSAIDKSRMVKFALGVRNLGLAYYFTGDKRYADKAKQQLTAWYIDPKTRMNPNMQHAQAIPGKVDGRGIGIIESRLFINVINSVELIRPVLSDSEYQTIVAWYKELVDWLLTSQNGIDEDNWVNNHGTWYDAQVVAMLIFIGDDERAKQRIVERSTARVRAHFDSEGQQQEELARTKPWHYTNFNLEAYSLLGHMGERLGVDFWHYQQDDVSLLQGYRFVAHYVLAPQQWTLKELKGFHPNTGYSNLLFANRAYKDPVFAQALATLKDDSKAQKDVHNLLFKPLAN